MSYWLNERAKAGTRAGYGSRWTRDAFSQEGSGRWCRHCSAFSTGVANRFTDDAFVGDVVVAYQADQESMDGFLRFAAMDAPDEEETAQVRSFYQLHSSFQTLAHDSRDRPSCWWRLWGEIPALLRSGS